MAEFKISQLKPFIDRRVCADVSRKEAMKWANIYAEIGKPEYVLKCIEVAGTNKEKGLYSIFYSPLVPFKHHHLLKKAYLNKAEAITWDVRDHATFGELCKMEATLNVLQRVAKMIGRKLEDYIPHEELKKLTVIVFQAAKPVMKEAAGEGKAAHVIAELAAMRRLAKRFGIDVRKYASTWEQGYLTQAACRSGIRKIVNATKDYGEMIGASHAISLLNMVEGCDGIDKHAELVMRGFAQYTTMLVIKEMKIRMNLNRREEKL
jgi:hypothetical protein